MTYTLCYSCFIPCGMPARELTEAGPAAQYPHFQMERLGIQRPIMLRVTIDGLPVSLVENERP
jgi:hypothetical protein